MNVAALSLVDRLEIVLKKTADLLPAEIGNQLRAMITFQNLAIMAGVIVAWAVSHFFGVGFIADAILLTVGVIALGGVALTAAVHLYDFAMLTYNATSEKDLNLAAEHLAKAITLVGLGTVAAILLKKKPGDTFSLPKDTKLPTYSQYKKVVPPLPSGVKLHKPKITFTNVLKAGEGETNPIGNIIIGRSLPINPKPLKILHEDVAKAIFHEKVHQLLTPKFYLLREFRSYLRLNGYLRSHLLRYLEEMLAEIYALLRLHGLSREYIIKGLKYPLDKEYISFTLLRSEISGVLLGPVNVAGMTYLVFYGIGNYDQQR